MTIGEKLLELRKEKRLSQEEVAEKLGVTRQTVSKWETDQSTPDFDKIAPLCTLYGITSDELLMGKKVAIKDHGEEEQTPDQAKKNALVVSLSVLLYFIGVIWIILSEDVFHLKEGLTISVFLLIVGSATVWLIYHFMATAKVSKKENISKEKGTLKSINAIITSITCVVYFVLSFLTMAWHITWILWVVNGLICEIVKLIFSLKKEDTHEK